MIRRLVGYSAAAGTLVGGSVAVMPVHALTHVQGLVECVVHFGAFPGEGRSGEDGTTPCEGSITGTIDGAFQMVFSYVEEANCLIGTAAGEFRVNGEYLVDFAWYRIGATVVLTLNHPVNGPGIGLAAFAADAAAVAECNGSPLDAVLTGVFAAA